MFSFSFRFPLLLDGRCNLCRKAKGMKGSTIKIIIISRKFLSPRYKTISDARMGGERRRSGMELLLIALRKKQRNETGSFKTPSNIEAHRKGKRKKLFFKALFAARLTRSSCFDQVLSEPQLALCAISDECNSSRKSAESKNNSVEFSVFHFVLRFKIWGIIRLAIKPTSTRRLSENKGIISGECFFDSFRSFTFSRTRGNPEKWVEKNPDDRWETAENFL